MGLHYNILWVDDQIEDIEEYGLFVSVKGHLQKLGFIPHIVPFKDIENAEQDLKTKKYDLILSDFNIGGVQKNGDVLISNIRAGKIYTEVLFYSAQSNFRDIAQKLFQDRVSFINLTERNIYRQLENKIKWLVDQTIRKFQEIESLRGLVMTETSHLDSIVENILISYFEADGKHKSTLRESILKKIIGSIEGNLDKDRRLKLASKSDSDIIKSRLFDANKKARTIQDLVSLEKINDDVKLKDFFKFYKRDVLNLRNDLAHAPVKSKNGVEYLVVSRKDSENNLIEEDVIFDLKKSIAIRKDLLEYERLLNLIQESISKEK